MIEKTIVFYVFRKTIDSEKFEKMDFINYYKTIKNKNILDTIMAKIDMQNIDIFKTGIKPVKTIIRDEFRKYNIV